MDIPNFFDKLLQREEFLDKDEVLKQRPQHCTSFPGLATRVVGLNYELLAQVYCECTKKLGSLGWPTNHAKFLVEKFAVATTGIPNKSTW